MNSFIDRGAGQPPYTWFILALVFNIENKRFINNVMIYDELFSYACQSALLTNRLRVKAAEHC